MLRILLIIFFSLTITCNTGCKLLTDKNENGKRATAVQGKKVESVLSATPRQNDPPANAGILQRKAEGETSVPGLRSSYGELSVLQAQAMPHMSVRSKEKRGFYGHSNTRHIYEGKSINSDKVVIDKATGLMWHQSGSTKDLSWGEAKRWIQKLNKECYAGYYDWRLPTLEEAATLLESGRKNGSLYIDTVFDEKQDLIWTGDRYGSGGMWSVNFSKGRVDWTRALFSTCHVRPIRSGITDVLEEEKQMSLKKIKWEWEITPEDKKAEEAEAKPGRSEFNYPLEKVETESIAEAKPRGQKIEITFNFQNADVKEVLKVILGDIMKLNYTVDKRVTGVITLRTEGKFYKEELLNIVQSMLNINGFAVVDDGNIFQVLPIQEARSEAGIVHLDRKVKAGEKEIITQIVPLNHVAPQVIIPTLRGLLTKAGFVIAPNDTNAIIISDNVANVDRLLKVIMTFDVPFFAGKALKFYEVKYADPVSLAKDLELVVQTLGASTKGPKLDISFIPFQDTNKILVATSTPDFLESVDSWISNIDIRLEENKPRMYIYKMQHEQAETTASILTELFKDKISPQENSIKTGTEPMKIIADKNTNSIIVKALPSDYQSIKTIIETLDATPQQVLIEAIIAEVTLTDSMSHGVEYFFRQKGRTSEGGNISLLPTGLTAGDTGILTGGIRAFTLNRDIDALFNMIASEAESEILTTPHILVRDEQTASIQVGQSEPIRSGTLTTTGGTTTDQIQYRDTGTILNVTPRIGENQMVTLDISQEVSSAVKTAASGIDSPTFPLRKTQTSLVVKSGHPIYLGGIIDVDNDLNVKKIPLLGDIPVVGNIFRSNDKSRKKTELMILITPHIINTTEEADRLSSEFKDKLEQIAKMRVRNR